MAPAGAITSTSFSSESSSRDADDFDIDMSGAYFCGDTSFFSLNWALHAIANQKLTGTLRSFWNSEPVELLARDGQIVLATTRDPELYCPEAPITLVNIDEERSRTLGSSSARPDGRSSSPSRRKASSFASRRAARAALRAKTFRAALDRPRVRFMFEQSDDLPSYAQSFRRKQTSTIGLSARCASSNFRSSARRRTTIRPPFPPTRAMASNACSVSG